MRLVIVKTSSPVDFVLMALLPTHTHIYIYMYNYIYNCICVFPCICVSHLDTFRQLSRVVVQDVNLMLGCVEVLSQVKLHCVY